MTVDFAKLISPDERLKITRCQTEMLRIFNLQDQFLGRAILNIARVVRTADPERFSTRLDAPRLDQYENRIVWALIPALAQQLGDTSLDANEKHMARSVPKDHKSLRKYAGQCLKNGNFTRNTKEKDVFEMRCLAHEIVNGNPISIALDRVAPPTAADLDWPARYTREISYARFDHADFSAWTPDMQYAAQETIDLMDDNPALGDPA